MLALPMAWYMARYTRGKMKAFFYIAVMLPMWASYIVKAYAWTLLLAKDGVAQWFLAILGWRRTEPGADDPGGRRQYAVDLRPGPLSGVRLYLAAVYDPAGAGGAGTLAAFAAAGLRRSWRPPAADLPLRGAAAGDPGIAAGSIFTFSLTLGDFIVPQLVGPPGFFIGNMVYSQQGAIGNMPMAAAFTLVPIVLIALYLAFVKRLGAFDAL
jgi:putative spermidine/putrescine transport system permease protein